MAKIYILFNDNLNFFVSIVSKNVLDRTEDEMIYILINENIDYLIFYVLKCKFLVFTYTNGLNKTERQ